MELDKQLISSPLTKPGVGLSATGLNAVEASDDSRVAKTDTSLSFNLGSQGNPSEAEMARRIEIIEAARSEIAAQSRSRLQIEREEGAGRYIYRLQDMQTGEVVRQWPPDSYIDLIAFLEEKRGGLVDQSA